MFLQDSGGNNGIMQTTSIDGTNWAKPKYIGFDTSGGPCAVTFNGYLHVFFRDADPSSSGLMHLYSPTGDTWSQHEHIGDLSLQGQPSAAVLPGSPETLCVIMVNGRGNGIMYTTFTTSWKTGYTGIETHDTSCPGLTTFNGKFFMVFQDPKGTGIMTATSSDGVTWAKQVYTGFDCTLGPCVLNVRGVLHAFYQDEQNQTGLMTITSNDGVTWVGKQHINNALVNFQPSAAVTTRGLVCVLMIDGTTERTNGIMFSISIDMTVITPSNTELINVLATFNTLPRTPSYRKYFKCKDEPTPYPAMLKSHFKGIACYKNKFILSHTDLTDSAQNGKWIIEDNLPGAGQFQTECVIDTLHQGWQHPCASQACGSFMVQGIQKAADGDGAKSSEIEILDIRMVAANMSPVLLGVISRSTIGINGVGMTKETGADGRYIIAAENGGVISFYRSKSPSLITNGRPTVEFDQLPYDGAFAESGAGLAMVTQQDGSIFMITLNADDDTTNSKACLYKLNDPTGTLSLPKITEINLPVTSMSDTIKYLTGASIFAIFPELVPLVAAVILGVGYVFLNSSFRWGKGLAITSDNTISLYASDRNVFPVSSVPIIGSDKDFSILVWESGNPPVITDSLRSVVIRPLSRPYLALSLNPANSSNPVSVTPYKPGNPSQVFLQKSYAQFSGNFTLTSSVYQRELYVDGRNSNIKCRALSPAPPSDSLWNLKNNAIRPILYENDMNLNAGSPSNIPAAGDTAFVWSWGNGQPNETWTIDDVNSQAALNFPISQRTTLIKVRSRPLYLCFPKVNQSTSERGLLMVRPYDDADPANCYNFTVSDLGHGAGITAADNNFNDPGVQVISAPVNGSIVSWLPAGYGGDGCLWNFLSPGGAIQLVRDTGLNLNVKAANNIPVSGAQVGVWGWGHGAPNETWDMVDKPIREIVTITCDDKNGTVYALTLREMKVLGIDIVGARVTTFQPGDSTHEWYRETDIRGSYITLQNRYNRLYLTLSGDNNSVSLKSASGMNDTYLWTRSGGAIRPYLNSNCNLNVISRNNIPYNDANVTGWAWGGGNPNEVWTMNVVG